MGSHRFPIVTTRDEREKNRFGRLHNKTRAHPFYGVPHSPKIILCREAVSGEIMNHAGKYTCRDYRQEMILLGLKRQLEDPGLPDSEKIRIARDVRELERQMGMD